MFNALLEKKESIIIDIDKDICYTDFCWAGRARSYLLVDKSILSQIKYPVGD